MKILIIGSKGFIGSHCVDLFSQAHEIWECDIVLNRNQSNYLYIDPAESNFNDIFINHKFDVCINCSGAANVPFSLEKPLNDFYLNTVNVFKILDAIRQHSPRCRFINLSSAAVYGNPEHLPIVESQPAQPVSPYGVHKEMAEMICEEFNRFWGVKTTCIRIFSAYGPRLKKQLFWDLAQKIMHEEQIELFGTGNESRDFIYIDDLVRLIECVMQKSDFSAEIINAGNGEQITVSRIANLMRTHMKSNKPIVFKGSDRKGDPINWEADITLASRMGYSGKVGIEEGIMNYIKWLKENGLV